MLHTRHPNSWMNLVLALHRFFQHDSMKIFYIFRGKKSANLLKTFYTPGRAFSLTRFGQAWPAANIAGRAFSRPKPTRPALARPVTSQCVVCKALPFINWDTSQSKSERQSRLSSFLQSNLCTTLSYAPKISRATAITIFFFARQTSFLLSR